MVKPLFMDPADLVSAWKKAVAANPDMPATPTVKVRNPSGGNGPHYQVENNAF